MFFTNENNEINSDKSKKPFTIITKRSEIKINIDKGTVIKKYKPTTKNFRTNALSCFKREKECLIRLKRYDHFPKILKTSEENLFIKMSYCGNKYDGKSRKHLIPQTKQIVKALKDEQIFIDSKNLIFKSIFIHNEILKMIDFEDAYPLGSNAIVMSEKFKNSRLERNDYIQFEKELELLVLGKYKNKIKENLKPVFSSNVRNFYTFQKFNDK